MGLDGRINVDVLFHDTDGTTSLKVVSLEGSNQYTAGKVAVVTGTCGTTAVTISGGGLLYRNAAGQLVTFSEYSRVAFQSSRDCTATDGDSVDNRCRSIGNVALCDWNPVGSSIDIEPKFTSGTASFTLVLYGT
jgi:hypothetical protein